MLIKSEPTLRLTVFLKERLDLALNELYMIWQYSTCVWRNTENLLCQIWFLLHAESANIKRGACQLKKVQNIY